MFGSWPWRLRPSRLLATHPDGLQRSVDLDRGGLTLLYLDRFTTDLAHPSDVYLRVTGAEPPVSGTGQAVDVQGHAGELTSSDARSTLNWERRARAVDHPQGVRALQHTACAAARGWYLKASLAGGSFVLMASSDLTAEQVLRVAGTVGVSP